MVTKRYTEQQIAFASHQADIVRKMQISEATFYQWKQMFDGMDAGEVRQLKQENRKSKQMVVARPSQRFFTRRTEYSNGSHQAVSIRPS
ncbi:MAG: transposase [Planctomycetota bacterium]